MCSMPVSLPVSSAAGRLANYLYRHLQRLPVHVLHLLGLVVPFGSWDVS